MLYFKTLNDAADRELSECYKTSPYLISDYSVGIKSMWRSIIKPRYAIDNGCLIVMTEHSGKVKFDLPLPICAAANISNAIESVLGYCREKFIPAIFENVPQAQLNLFVGSYKRLDITCDRNLSDYVYLTAKLSEMSGRAYSAQRNHIKKFHTNYPAAVFKVFTRSDIPLVNSFLRRFTMSFSKIDNSAVEELELAEKMVSRIGSECFRCGGYVYDGEVISMCLSEKCGDMLIDHIEKALTEFEGIYPATVQAFIKEFGSDVKYFNREDDASDQGLRMSKLQYHPYTIVDKYTVTIKNELSFIDVIPEISSQRLSYSAIAENDIEEYNRLCLDEVRNKYWGYDYKCDCEEPDKTYFYLDQKKDFTNRMSLSFAIRLDGVMIGEAILYNFDYHGAAEIGIRLLSEYDGYGYGREALRRIISYALYGIGLDRINAKCYADNKQSSNMLSTVMRKIDEDSSFEHYVATF